MAENLNKTGPIENVLGVARTAAETAREFKTIADKFIDDWGLRPEKRTEGAYVPGRPPAPAISDYPSQWSKESLDQKIEDIRSSAQGLGAQIKGLFNLAYESPTGGQTAARIPGPRIADAQAMSPAMMFGIIALLFLIGTKR